MVSVSYPKVEYARCRYCGEEMIGIMSHEAREMHRQCEAKHKSSPNKRKPKLTLGVKDEAQA